ncbi:MAG: DUF4230 domain-containing protein [Lachnospiraceae bacterium]
MKGSKKRFIIGIIIVIALLIVVFVIFFKGYNCAQAKYEKKIAKLEAEIDRLSEPIAVYEEATEEIDINVINVEIRNIGELATLEYLYTNAGKFEDAKQLWGKDVPFTKKSFIAKWDGTIKAGVNVQEIAAEIDNNSKQITVHIPKAKILSHELDDESFETLDEKDGLFNPIKIDDTREFDTESKNTMEIRAIENGLLDKAFENAKDIIYKLINTDVVEKQGYSIVFEVIE